MKYVIKLLVSSQGDYFIAHYEYGFYKTKSDAISARDVLINKILFVNQAYCDNIFYTLNPSELGFDEKYELCFGDRVYILEIHEVNYSTSCDDGTNNSRIYNEIVDAMRRCNPDLASVMNLKRNGI